MVSLSCKGRRTLVDSPRSSRQRRKGLLSPLLQRILPALIILSLWIPVSFAADIVVRTAEDRLDTSFATFDPTTNLCGTVVDSAAFPTVPSLREALIYANHTPEPDTITFAPSLSGQAIMISFDGLDEGEQADPLPTLCGGNITLNGDVNGDRTPDITLDGSGLSSGNGLYIVSDNNTIHGLHIQSVPWRGIFVLHYGTAAVSGNTITNNTIDGGQVGIVVRAGDSQRAGTVQDTAISGNTVSGATFYGISVWTGPVSGSSIDGTRITDNVIRNNNSGILILANFSAERS